MNPSEAPPKPEHSLSIVTRLNEPQQLQEAARILYDAFKLKVERLELFPHSPEQACTVIAKSLNPARGLYALKQGKVVGVMGLEYGSQRFVQITRATLLEAFGLWGGLWRYLWRRLLRLVEPLKPQVFRIEPLAVSAELRGQGVGSALLTHACEQAQALGYPEIIIGVVNSNRGAKRLYERHGFRVFKSTHYGLLTKRAGFTGGYTLRKTL